MMPVDCGSISSKVAKKENQLTMVDDSVDDMYFGCNDKMMTIVQDRLLEHEKSVNNFGIYCESSAKKKFDLRGDTALTIDHIWAICVYTNNSVYREFNTAVRTEGRSYLASFKYYSFHYLLTSAIQILNNNSSCNSTFRRINMLFTGTVNQIIRFGSFASTSFRSNLKHFGTQTCFKINTCLGASLKEYSVYPTEEEVLIPPYETFKITEINRKNTFPDLKDCEVVFVLESAGVMSSLNCNAVRNGLT